MPLACPASTLWVPGAPVLPEPAGCCFTPPPPACASIAAAITPGNPAFGCNAALPPSTVDQVMTGPTWAWNGVDAYELTLDVTQVQINTARDDGVGIFGWPFGTLVGRNARFTSALTAAGPAGCAPYTADIDVTAAVTLDLGPRLGGVPVGSSTNVLQILLPQIPIGTPLAGLTVTVSGATFKATAPVPGDNLVWRWDAASSTLVVAIAIPDLDYLITSRSVSVRVQYSGPAATLTTTTLIDCLSFLPIKCDSPAILYNYDGGTLTVDDLSGFIQVIPTP